jgi:hypothetical protein
MNAAAFELAPKRRRALFALLHGLSGVYAGACVSIALVDLRCISALEDGALALAVMKVVLPAMGALMLPQLLVMSMAMASWYWRPGSLPMRAWIPVALLAAIWLVTAGVHIPLNRRFIDEQLLAAEVLSMVDRWLNFHWLRTALALALPFSIAHLLRPSSAAATTRPIMVARA